MRKPAGDIHADCQGLPAALVQTGAKGPADPVADNASAVGRARDRRTEVVFEGVRSVAR